MYKAGFTISLNGGRVTRTALVEKTELNAEYDKLLEAALAELGDMYFAVMSPHLGSRYADCAESGPPMGQAHTWVGRLRCTST